MIRAIRVPRTALRVLGVTTGVAALAAAVPVPGRADLLGNAFLSALTNAGISYTQPANTLALGQSVCPMLVAPGESFDSVAAKMADSNGMSYHSAGVFTIVAVATFCPAMIAPLLPNRFGA
ncbi:MAG TPA: DUF732 domain-containing protein [Mycobacterium sp.]|nr:DUF732 domain-containing protein [Mycobacterium sp.]